MGEQGPGDLQQVSPAEGRRRTALHGALPALVKITVRPAGLKKFELGEKGELLHQEGQQLQHRESFQDKHPNVTESSEPFYPPLARGGEGALTTSPGQDWARGTVRTCAFSFIQILSILLIFLWCDVYSSALNLLHTKYNNEERESSTCILKDTNKTLCELKTVHFFHL